MCAENTTTQTQKQMKTQNLYRNFKQKQSFIDIKYKNICSCIIGVSTPPKRNERRVISFYKEQRNSAIVIIIIIYIYIDR